MQRQFKIPLIFFFIAACLGLLLRWHFVTPQTWLKYPHWLHAHSHIMFLGWVFNVLILAYISNYDLPSRYRKLFIFIQALLVGMLISFPLQGYGPVSITISTLHTFSVWIFSFWMFRDLKTGNSTSIWFAKSSLILFILSSLGPFALGPLMASGLAQSKWYYFAVYYYLHFQYNGVFIFGLLSLFFKLLEEKGISYDTHARRFGILLFVSLFPAYFLSTLWASPGIIFNAIGLTGATLQLISLYYFAKMIQSISIPMNRQATILMTASLSAFILKALLQFISAHPVIAQMALDTRPFTIAYLHLVVIGVVTFFLLAWYIEKGLIKVRSHIGLRFLITGFVGSELVMIASGVPFFINLPYFQIPILLLVFSALILLGTVILMFRLFLPAHVKNG
ncbi:MAG TPA: hypothetical protein VFW11_19680 [Cyclobacteriaceae bacterium]|nr:hypothetical protein [Cyclobacteriaceae bacterium]